jgi:hypothetical protein
VKPRLIEAFPTCVLLSFLSVPALGTVVLEAEPNDSPGEANVAACGDVIEGSISFSPSGDVDLFVFALAQVSDLHVYTTTEGDTIIELLDSDGVTILESDDDSGDGFASHIGRVQQAAGTYFVRVRAFAADATFDYTLSIQCLVSPPEVEPNDSFATATPLRCVTGGGRGDLDPADDSDIWTLTVGTATHLDVLVVSVPEQADKNVTLLDAADRFVAGASVSGDQALGASFEAIVDPGTYFLSLTSMSNPVHYDFLITCSTVEDCSAGSVNAAAGPPQPVLFVNGEAGRVSAAIGASIEVLLASPSQGPNGARYVIWLWNGASFVDPQDVTFNGHRLGCSVNPTPFHPDRAPQPLRCLLGASVPMRACGGVEPVDSPPIAPWALIRHLGFSRPVRFMLQGIIEDEGAGNATGFSMTNAVVLTVD